MEMRKDHQVNDAEQVRAYLQELLKAGINVPVGIIAASHRIVDYYKWLPLDTSKPLQLSDRIGRLGDQ